MAAVSDRRTLLRLAMAAAVAPALASRLAAADPARADGFAPPTGPMSFTRRLVRNMGDGNKLLVSRSFAVRFAPRADGWSVAGEQVDVAVDFPPRLAPLAVLERQRKEVDLFPLLLDRDGMIVGGPDPRPAKQLDEAIASVMRGFDRTAHSPGDRKEHEAFIRAVREAGTRLTSRLPAWLFAPQAGSGRAERDLALPDGGRGTIEVSFTAVADPMTGLLRQARRDIVTTIAAESRLTREDWTLAAL